MDETRIRKAFDLVMSTLPIDSQTQPRPNTLTIHCVANVAQAENLPLIEILNQTVHGAWGSLIPGTFGLVGYSTCPTLASAMGVLHA